MSYTPKDTPRQDQRGLLIGAWLILISCRPWGAGSSTTGHDARPSVVSALRLVQQDLQKALQRKQAGKGAPSAAQGAVLPTPE